MAYLGRGLDKISNIEVLDNITFDGSSSYSITKGSVAFTPNSAQSCLISIDGVVQATNFTVSSSTINFGVAVASTSTCNFFLHYGTGVMTVPSDGSVTTAKLGSNAVTSAKMFSGFANGITELDQWRLTSTLSLSGNSTTAITTNLERNDTAGFSKIGTGMTESSGVFSFPSTGIYEIYAFGNFFGGLDMTFCRINIQTTQDNGSNYTLQNTGNAHTFNGYYIMAPAYTVFDVTDISTHKVKFEARHQNSGNLEAGTTNNVTWFIFKRIGDT